MTTPPPLPAPAARPRRRSFWRSPLGVLTVIGLSFAMLVFVSLAAIGIGGMTGYFPATNAVRGDQLQDRVVDILREADIIEADERVLYYYSAGLFDFLEDGNLFTDRRVISYATAGDEFWHEWAAYEDIDEITVTWTDSVLEDTEITVHTTDDGEFYLFVSNENGGDRKFHDELHKQWEAHR